MTTPKTKTRPNDLLQHADDIWRLCVRLVGNHADAEECFQQTFADALAYVQRHQSNSTILIDTRRLLLRIATRRAMDRLRRRYRDREIHVALIGEPVSSESVGKRAELHELRESVRRVLATLPPQQSEAFLLRYIEELSVSQVALQMGVKPNHVRVLVHRALAVLRKALAQDTSVPNDTRIQRQGS